VPRFLYFYSETLTYRMLKPLQIPRLIFLFASTLFFTGCYSTFEVVSQNYNYDNDITFTVDKVQEGNNISTGNGYYYAKNGSKFVFLYISLKNNSDTKKKLDFDNFYLLEPKSHTKYKVELAMLETVVNMFGNVNSEIQKNDTKKRKLVFTFPKGEKAEMLSVNDVIYHIHYSGNSGG
jgi:hypothetical protein